MLTLEKVAITGGPASGKSTVCRFFKECGAYVLSADDIVHQLLTTESEIGQQVIALLGKDIVTHHHIDRTKIAEKVFEDKTLLEALEGLLHPAVKKEILHQYDQVAHSQSHPLFVVEIPLLFEAGWEDAFDMTIAVIADTDTCRKRFEQGPEEYERRLQRQLPPKEKAKRANTIILNNGTLEEMRETVKTLFKELS